MKKGLRHQQRKAGLCLDAALKPCPDEEGIKTAGADQLSKMRATLKPCPDEEGIKT